MSSAPLPRPVANRRPKSTHPFARGATSAGERPDGTSFWIAGAFSPGGAFPRRLLALAAALAVFSAAAQEKGALRVTVTDQDWEAPISEATVYLLETDARMTTGEDGQVLFEDLAPGAYSLSVSATGFERKVLRDVTVLGGQVRHESGVLAASYTEMDEFVVKEMDFDAAGSDLQLLNLQAQSMSVVDAVGADMMSKAGAGTAAAALKMVSGATVQDGKYAVIRGLGDRYTSTAINNVRLPNADRDRRAVSLDQFPSAMIESIQVNKTFMPDQQGDATGGINITTKGVPDKTVIQASFSMEYDTMATRNRDFKTYEGGGHDFWGMRGVTKRNFWDTPEGDFPRGSEERVRKVKDDDGNVSDIVFARRQFGTAIENKAPPMNQGFKFTLGDYVEAGDWKFGGIALGSHSHKYKYRQGEQGILNITPNKKNFDVPTGIRETWSTETSSDDLLWSAGLTLGAQNEHNNVRLTTLYTHQSRDTVEIRHGPPRELLDEGPVMMEASGPPRLEFNEWGIPMIVQPMYPARRTVTDTYLRDWRTLMHYVENANASVQLAGDHTFSFLNDAVFDWGVSYNVAESVEPDRRDFSGVYMRRQVDKQANNDPNRDDPDSTPVWETDTLEESSAFLLEDGSRRRRWQDTRETSFQWQFNYKQPFVVAEGWEGWLKTGWFKDYVERAYRNRIYSFSVMEPVKAKNEHDFAKFGKLDALSLGAPGQDSIQYDGRQKISAHYMMGRLPLPEWLDVVGGARVEKTYLSTRVFNAPGIPNSATTLRLFRLVDEGYIRRATAEYDLTSEQADSLKQLMGAIGWNNTGNLKAGDTEIDQVDVLPAIMFNLKPVEQLSLRLSYAETIARPIFKEITPILYPDLDSSRVFVGNPELKISRLQNYDARIEFRPDKRSVDNFSAGVFYKKIRDPIQYSTREGPVGFDQDFVLPENYSPATIRGVEFEARKELGFISSYLSPLSVGGNLTLQRSEVKYREDMTDNLERAGVNKKTRPMDGQSDVLANANIIYDNKNTGLSLGVFYNWRGEMYVSGDSATPSRYYPAIVENPVGTLDATLGYEFKFGASSLSPKWRMAVECKNLLDAEFSSSYRAPREDFSRSSYRQGRTYSVSLGCTW